MKKLGYYLFGLIFCLLIYGIIERNHLKNHNKKKVGLILEQIYNPKNSIAKNWRVVYLQNNELYFTSITGDYKYGDKVVVKHDPKNPERNIIEEGVVGRFGKDEVLFIGDNYPFEIRDKKIKVYVGENLIKEFKFKRNFGFYHNQNSTLKIQLLINNRAINTYEFDFKEYKNKKFHAINLEYSNKVKWKKIKYIEKDKFLVKDLLTSR